MNSYKPRTLVRYAAALLLAVTAQAAPATWYLNQVNFADGGTASGSFQYDPVTNQYSAINITTTNGSARSGSTYGIVITPLLNDANIAQFASGAPTANYTGRNGLSMAFSSPLTAAGGTIAIKPYNYPTAISIENACTDADCLNISPPSRAITSGSVSTTPPLTFSCSPSTGPTQVGVFYTTTCTVSGGVPPYAFGLNPPNQLPAGLQFTVPTATTAKVSGTPTTAGNYTFGVFPQDGTGQLLNKTVTFTGTLVSPCSYTFPFNPATTTITWPANGSAASILLQTQAGCAWTATSNAAWLTLNTPNGTGQSQVLFTPTGPNNTGSTRTGTVVIAGTTINVSQPSNCTFTLNPTSMSVPATAGSTGTAVTAPAGCAWTATSNSAFITIASGANGSGNGPVAVDFTANPSQSQRSGTVTIGGQTFTVNQAGASCNYQVTNTNMTPAPGGATGSSAITAPAGCTWTAVSNVPWVTITSGSSGSGNGTVNYLVAANPNSSQRTGTATVAGQTVNFTQSGSACTFSLSNTSASVPASGGSGSTNVSTGADCSWSATTGDSWINITAGGSTVGSGTMQFTAQANPNPTARSGIIVVAGQQFAVNQAAGSTTCSYTLSSSNGTISANGGILSVTLTTGPTCTWSVISPDSFVNITSGLNGTGPATISINIVSNPSAASRNSTITIGGQSYFLSQSGTQAGGISTGPLRFVALEPCRVMETRAEYNFQGRTGAFGPPYMRANETRTLTPPASNVCQVPSTAKAYLVNVTLIPRAGVDYVTLYPTGEGRPQFYSVRSPDGQVVANSAIVKAGVNGAVDVFASNDTDMIIDIAGYFTDNANVSNLVFYPLTPCRVVDTRSDYRAPSGAYGPPSMNQRETRRVRFPGTPFCSIPNGAAAYSMTITAVPQGPLQYLTAWPSGGAQPNVSSINSPAGRVLANSVILPASSDGSIDVFTYDRTDFLIDINGYFAPDDGSTGLYYYPVTQCRAADSTSNSLPGAFGGPIYQSEIVRTLNIPTSPGCSSIPSTAKAYVVNVTAEPGGLGLPFITAYPTGQSRPNASILNAFQGQIVTNTAVVPAGTNGSIDVYAYGNRTNVIVDISGYFGR